MASPLILAKGNPMKYDYMEYTCLSVLNEQQLEKSFMAAAYLI
jgi:hypothetical protein